MTKDILYEDIKGYFHVTLILMFVSVVCSYAFAFFNNIIFIPFCIFFYVWASIRLYKIIILRKIN